MPGRELMYKKSIKISSYEGELQSPKKGMGSMNKKGKIGGLKFWSSGVKYKKFKKLPIEKGKIMEIHEKCGFSHDFAYYKNLIITNTCNYLDNALL
jgi:hypothetical protein